MASQQRGSVLTRDDLLLEMREMRAEINTRIEALAKGQEYNRTTIEAGHRDLMKEIARVDADVKVHRAETTDLEGRLTGVHRTVFGPDGRGGLTADVANHESNLRTLRWILAIVSGALILVVGQIVLRIIEWITGGR